MPANTETRRRAEDALRGLEAQWISLLRWLAQQMGLSEDELVSGWKADVYLTANDRLQKDSRAFPDAGWTALNYLDFGRYAELAGFGEYGRKLEQLGSPPRNWKAILDELNTRAGAIQYRNHLAHGGRFDALPLDKQEEAAGIFQAGRDHLKTWWPDVRVTVQRPLPTESEYRTAIRLLTTDPNSAASLVEQLGMQFVSNAPNLITDSVATPLSETLANDFLGLHRAGTADLDGVNAAVYLAYLPEWSHRSSEREKSRRKLAKALIEHQVQDPRWLAVLMDGTGKTPEAEFIVPRQRTGRAFGTIRASVDLQEPNHYHIELLNELKVRPGTTLPELSRQWNQALSVERVTKRFYDEFRELRNRIRKALLEHNADNPAIAGRDPDEDKTFNLQLHAFATRQLGRMLFLWFIQQKRWLGGTAGHGETDFVLDLFRQHDGAGASFYNDVLLPVFFEGLGLPIHHQKHREVEACFGPIPYLGGGLFRAGADQFEADLLGLQADGTRANRINLPDDLFDPLEDQPSDSGRPSAGRTVLGLLRGYRFTTQESTPDDQSVDPDPELLGKVFENLYQGDDRHDTGAYYTPREIVHFMCRQALDGYLRSRAGVDQEILDWLREEAIDWTVSYRRLGPVQHSALVEALDDVKIVDPAVGSGAFLVASLQEIVLLRRGILQSADDRDIEAGSVDVADWKRRTITNSLYGVDINPMAVEICHLRLWLSMVVELDVSDYHHIPSLPNLDLRVVAGDSLIDRMGEERFVHSLGGEGGVQANFETVDRVGRLLTEIEGLQHRFAGEGVHDPMRLVQWRNEIRHKQMEVARIQLDDAMAEAERALSGAAGSTQAARRRAEQHLANLRGLRHGLRDDAPYQKPFLWPVNFPEVFDRGGFDIVVANPPYVRMEALDNTEEASYAGAFAEVAASRADLLVYFYARAVQALKAGGQLAFIASNSFVKRDYGRRLRSLLCRQLSLSRVVDFGESRVFDAVVEPFVLVGMKQPPREGQPLDGHYLYAEISRRAGARSSVSAVRQQIEGLESLLASDHVHLTQQEFCDSDWKIEPREILDLFGRLQCQGQSLFDLAAGKIYWGAKTGLNHAFIIDNATRQRLVDSDPRCAEVIRPWVRGQDLKNWVVGRSDLHVIFLHRNTDIEDYPSLKQHLLTFKSRLERRATAHAHPWWQLQQPQQGIFTEFSRPKVLWPDIARKLRFSWDETGSVPSNTTYFCAELPLWSLTVLNSTVFEFIACIATNSIRGSFIRLFTDNTRDLRVPSPNEAMKRALNAFAATAIRAQGKRSSTEDVDSLVSSAYGLSLRDLERIYDWFSHRSLEDPDEGADEQALNDD